MNFFLMGGIQKFLYNLPHQMRSGSVRGILDVGRNELYKEHKVVEDQGCTN